MFEPGDLVGFIPGNVYRHIKSMPTYDGVEGTIVDQTVLMLVLSGNRFHNDDYRAAQGQWHLVLSPAGVGWIFSDWVSRQA